jgi:hypothetical protein
MGAFPNLDHDVVDQILSNTNLVGQKNRSYYLFF